ncbi:hypothetical protein WG909_07450 [Peptostreptococcaceae bacterium AGR-M142]
MKKTKFLNLTKPTYDDGADVMVLNKNWDYIDEELEKNHQQLNEDKEINFLLDSNELKSFGCNIPSTVNISYKGAFRQNLITMPENEADYNFDNYGRVAPIFKENEIVFQTDKPYYGIGVRTYNGLEGKKILIIADIKSSANKSFQFRLYTNNNKSDNITTYQTPRNNNYNTYAIKAYITTSLSETNGYGYRVQVKNEDAVQNTISIKNIAIFLIDDNEYLLSIDELTKTYKYIKNVEPSNPKVEIRNIPATNIIKNHNLNNYDFWFSNYLDTSIEDRELRLLANKQFQNIHQIIDKNPKESDKWFIYSRIKATTDSVVFYINDGVTQKAAKRYGQLNEYADYYTNFRISKNPKTCIVKIQDNSENNFDYIYLDGNDGIFAINMTKLGIEDYSDNKMLSLVENIPPKYSKFELNDWLANDEKYEDGFLTKYWKKILLSDYLGEILSIEEKENVYYCKITLNIDYGIYEKIKVKFRDFIFIEDNTLDAKHIYAHGSLNEIIYLYLFIPKLELEKYIGINVKEKLKNWIDKNNDYIYYKEQSQTRTLANIKSLGSLLEEDLAIVKNESFGNCSFEYPSSIKGAIKNIVHGIEINSKNKSIEKLSKDAKIEEIINKLNEIISIKN